MIASFYNSQVVDLFNNSRRDLFLNRVPMIYNELQESDIVFVGINPSFIDIEKSQNFVRKNCSNNDKLSYLAELSQTQYEFLFYDFKNLSKNVKTLGDIHCVFKENYGYFSKFHYISTQLGLTIEHLDLIPVRETAQNRVAKLLGENEIFVNNCLNLFIEVLELINPKAVIVENSLAREILMLSKNEKIREFFPDYNFANFKENQIGTPINRHGVAIYYTSMLTGQRAMDLGSLHRLLWSVDKHFTT